MFKRILKSKTLKLLTGLFLLLIAATWWCNHWIVTSTQSQLYSNIDSIPFRKVGLILGTNKSWHEVENPYFKYRIEAAVKLFKTGKIKHIIVSGDNHLSYYDETKDMEEALIKAGIPDSCITPDYAGFRTFDSMVRCLLVFGQDSVTVISQRSHNERALFIANYYKMNTVAFNAQEPSTRFSLQTNLREYFAKCKAVLDLYILHTSPHFLGQKIKV